MFNLKNVSEKYIKNFLMYFSVDFFGNNIKSSLAMHTIENIKNISENFQHSLSKVSFPSLETSLLWLLWDTRNLLSSLKSMLRTISNSSAIDFRPVFALYETKSDDILYYVFVQRRKNTTVYSKFRCY